jgi:hypothetical protein
MHRQSAAHRWLQVVVILPVGGSTKNSLSVVIFIKEVLNLNFMFFFNIGRNDRKQSF